MTCRLSRNGRQLSLTQEKDRKAKTLGLFTKSTNNNNDIPDDCLLHDIIDVNRRHSSYQIQQGPLTAKPIEKSVPRGENKYRGSLYRQRTKEAEQQCRRSVCYPSPLIHMNDTHVDESVVQRYDVQRISMHKSVQSKDNVINRVETKTKKMSTTARKPNQTTSRKLAKGEVFVWKRNQDNQTQERINTSTTSANVEDHFWSGNYGIVDTNCIKDFTVMPPKGTGHGCQRNDVLEWNRIQSPPRDLTQQKMKSPTKKTFNGIDTNKPYQILETNKWCQQPNNEDIASENFYEQNIRQSRAAVASVYDNSCANAVRNYNNNNNNNNDNRTDQETEQFVCTSSISNMTSVEIFVPNNNFKERRRLRVSERRLHGIGDDNDDNWRDDDVSTLSDNSGDDDDIIVDRGTTDIDFNPQQLSSDEDDIHQQQQQRQRASPYSIDERNTYNGMDETYTTGLISSPSSMQGNNKEYHSVSTPTTMSETEYGGSTDYNHTISGCCDDSCDYPIHTMSTFEIPLAVDSLNKVSCIDQYQTNIMDTSTNSRRESYCSYKSNNNRRISGTSAMSKGTSYDEFLRSPGPCRHDITVGSIEHRNATTSFCSPSNQMRNERNDSSTPVHSNSPSKKVNKKNKIKGGTVVQQYYVGEYDMNNVPDSKRHEFKYYGNNDDHVNNSPNKIQDPSRTVRVQTTQTNRHKEDQHHQQQHQQQTQEQDHHRVQMVEVAPMVFSRLRPSTDVYEGVKSDFYIPIECEALSCKAHGELTFCIQDVDYVICPLCKALNKNPLGLGFVDGGVGIGFTFNELSAMQLEIAKGTTNTITNNNHSSNSICNNHKYHHNNAPTHNNATDTTIQNNNTYRIERYQL